MFSEREWAVQSLPAAYLQHNRPVISAARSPGAGHLALAGRRGLLLLHAHTHKFRVFGNVNHEGRVAWAGCRTT